MRSSSSASSSSSLNTNLSEIEIILYPLDVYCGSHGIVVLSYIESGGKTFILQSGMYMMEKRESNNLCERINKSIVF